MDSETPVIARLEVRRNADGVVRDCGWEWDYDGEFMWTGGNYGCDCNRFLFFQRAAGEPDDEDVPCGGGVDYSVRLTAKDGRVLFCDGAEWTVPGELIEVAN